MTAETAPVPTTTVLGSRSTDSRVLGGLILTFGVGWLVRQLGVDLSWEAIVASVLLALGVAMMATPRAGQGIKLWILGIVLTVALASMSSVSTKFPGGGVGDRTVAPGPALALRDRYNYAGGVLHLDLTDLPINEGETKRTAVELGAGQLIVTVPEGVGVRLSGNVLAGQVVAFGREISAGLFEDPEWTEPGYAEATKKLSLRFRLMAGEVVLRRPGDPMPARDRHDRRFDLDFRN